MAIPTPFSQSFQIDPNAHPFGIFVHSVDLCFSFKDDSLPITLQLRPLTSGFPDPITIYHNAQVTMYPDAIPTTDGGDTLPNLNDPTTFARFVFPAPVYLPPGPQAMVLQTASTQYFIYMATLQDPNLGTGAAISAQPYVGNLYRSQNSDTWQAYPSEAIMFKVNQCVFDINDPSVVEFDVIAPLPTANVNMDTLLLSVNDIAVGSTKINYTFESTDSITGSLAATASPIQPNENYYPSDRQVLTTSNGSFKVFTTMGSSSSDVSPMLDPTRLNVIGVENIINNGQLSNTLIQVTAPGLYTFAGGNGNVAITIAAPDASGGTQATANLVVVNNVATGVFFTALGTGYYTTPTANVTVPTPTPTTNATVSVTGETSASGGNALARYITRQIVLAPGFAATDLQVYLVANKQVGTDIQVYYKVMSAFDSDQSFLDKPYTRMTLNTNKNQYSKSTTDYYEYSYISPAAAAIPPGRISYTTTNGTFNSFQSFAIKICLFASSTSTVPEVSSLRGIAIS